MNSVELKIALVSMCEGIITPELSGAIIDIIMRHYMTFSGYYEEDAIRTMKGFIDTKILVW